MTEPKTSSNQTPDPKHVEATLKRHRHRLLIAAGMALHYNGGLKYKMNDLKEADAETDQVDPSILTEACLNDLGFGNWDGTGLRLIPLWAVSAITPGISVQTINGDLTQFDPKGDLDHRCGYLAVGVMPRDIEH